MQCTPSDLNASFCRVDIPVKGPSKKQEGLKEKLKDGLNFHRNSSSLRYKEGFICRLEYLIRVQFYHHSSVILFTQSV